MDKKNSVFIATSLDGKIADKNGGIDWLHNLPNPNNEDMGYAKFMDTIDALLMGRTTYETVAGFDIDWPYQKPVFVLSNTLTEIPKNLNNKVFLVKGELIEVLKHINSIGHGNLYIDGGKTIQSFLKEDLIDEIILTTIPILLGGGSSLFSDLSKELNFELKNSRTFLNQIVQSHFLRKR